MQEQTIDVQKYLQIFLRHKALIIIIFTISVAFSVMAVLSMPNIYRSRCVLLIRSSSKLDKMLLKSRDGRIEAQDLLGMVREKILGWEAVNSALEACELDKDIPKDDPKFLENLYFRTIDSAEVSAIGKDLISISYEGENPYINYKMVDSLVSTFLEYSLKLSRTEAEESLDFIVRDLDRLKNNLNAAERKLQMFEEEHIAEMPLSEGGKRKQLTETNEELEELERQILIANERLIALNTRTESESASITGELVEEANPKVAELMKHIIDTEIELDDLRARYYDGHPSISVTEKRLNKLQKKLEEEKEKVISKETFISNPVYLSLMEKKFEVELQLKTYYAREKDLESQIATLQEQVAIIPALKQKMAKLQRDYNVNKELYVQRLQQRSRAELEKELSLSTRESPFNIVEPARISYKPINSKKQMVLLLGIVLGGAASFGLAFGMELIDQRFKGSDEARDYLQIPVFGMIPPIVTRGDLIKRRRKRMWQLVSVGAGAIFIGALTTACFKVEPLNEAVLSGIEKIQKKVQKFK